MPSTPSTPSLILGIVLAVSVAVVGLAAFWPAESPEQGPPIGHNASERLASLDGYTAVVESEYTFGNESNRSVQRMWVRPSTGERRVESIAGPTDSVVVSNGSVTWLYDRDSNNVTRLNVTGQADAARQQGERIERLFTRLNISRDAVDEPTTADIEPGGAPLPSVPPGQPTATPQAPAVDAADRFGVRYEGTDTVADREVYVLSIQPETSNGNATAFNDYEQTLYVDTEWFLPLKTHTEWETDGRRIETTTTYLNVTFEPGIDDDRFTFDPPENATVVDPGIPSVQRFDSLPELRANTDLPVPDPDIPDGYEFERAQLLPGEFRSASLRYTSDTSVLTVSVDNATTLDGSLDGERLTEDGRQYLYREFGTTRTLVFECDEFGYTVSGSGVTKADLLDIAGSIECG